MHDMWVQCIGGMLLIGGKLQYLEQDFFQYHFLHHIFRIN